MCLLTFAHTHTHTHTHIHTSNAHTHYKHIYNTTNKYALSHIVIFSTCLASLLVILSFHCLTDDTDVHIACQDKIVERTDAHRYVLAFSEISIQHVVSILPILRDYMGGTLRLRPIPFQRPTSPHPNAARHQKKYIFFSFPPYVASLIVIFQANLG